MGLVDCMNTATVCFTRLQREIWLGKQLGIYPDVESAVESVVVPGGVLYLRLLWHELYSSS